MVEAVLRVHRLPEATIGNGYAFPDLASGLECMRAVMQAGIRPQLMRLYDAEDTTFNGYDLGAGECLLVIATAGLADVAKAEAAAVKKFAGDAKDLGDAPWERWRRHRFDLSADLLKAFLEPANTFLDVIEVATPARSMSSIDFSIVQASVGGCSSERISSMNFGGAM